MKIVLFLLFIYFQCIFCSGQQAEEVFTVVSPTKMNVVYIGLDNPFEIIAPGLSDEKTMVSVSSGKISKAGSPHCYNITATKPGKLTLSLFTVSRGDTVFYGQREFRVKRVPDPVATVAGMNNGYIAKEVLIAQTGVKTDLPNCDFDLKFRVVSYTVSCWSGEYSKEVKVIGAAFTNEVYEMLGSCRPGHKIYFEDIKVVSPDGCIRNIGSFFLKIM